MAQKTAPDSNRRSERSRRAIYDAALALVGEIGYPKTTIEGIAARAGVGKQTIYRWWSSKAEVLMEAFIDLGVQAAEAAGAGDWAEADGIPDTGDVEADLKAVLRATVDELLDPRYDAPARALAAEGVANPAFGEEFVGRLLMPALELYVRRLRAAQDAGQIRADVDPYIARDLFSAPLAQRWLQGTGPLDHAYADTLVEYVLYGLSPR
ncbi:MULTISPECIES: TetR/AcrR family transcriptional regulator [unclassified Streptomyces]|uniref:TetR/AcrR family transcriptional regulator n=1 Tax=unclassified Streptomyces TaxID=2593676 RepID=UPI0022542974|nr:MULTISPECIES: TetR/AcrR family transcriptional regulator [unclassified Streptomyces]MCX5436983.1 TetR/AcrR family transcriptional regulator [Streptomyces sp. NBC_00063]WSE14711.1 TetR/AcrR family transcriptional regulator [Streptomyces sp. NBC_01397]WUB96373.1 TetR/AcrR family transcriptional regulator [Streptomyces sp. NBC_00569]